MTMIDFFDRTRIINLASRSDRREETDAEFAKYGFPDTHRKSGLLSSVLSSVSRRVS